MRSCVYICIFLFIVSSAIAAPFYIEETTENEAIRLSESCLEFIKNDKKHISDISAFGKKLKPVHRYSKIPERFKHLRNYNYFNAKMIKNIAHVPTHMITIAVSETRLPSRVIRACHISYEEQDVWFEPIPKIIPDSQLVAYEAEHFYTPRKSHRQIIRRIYCDEANNSISISDAKVRATKGNEAQQSGRVIINYPDEGALQPPVRHLLFTNSACDKSAS